MMTEQVYRAHVYDILRWVASEACAVKASGIALPKGSRLTEALEALKEAYEQPWIMIKQPSFTHAELMQLWHAIGEMAATSRTTTHDPLLTAREKLDDYVLAQAVKPGKVVPLG